MTLVMTLGRKVQAFRAFRHRDFRWFWFGAVAQATGMGTQFLILSWFVLELTGSASRMGFAIFLFGMTGLVVVSLYHWDSLGRLRTGSTAGTCALLRRP